MNNISLTPEGENKMKIETIPFDKIVGEHSRTGKWLPMLANLPPDKMLRIVNGNPKSKQMSILGSFRIARRAKKEISFEVHTAIRGEILYVWKEEIK